MLSSEVICKAGCHVLHAQVCPHGLALVTGAVLVVGHFLVAPAVALEVTFGSMVDAVCAELVPLVRVGMQERGPEHAIGRIHAVQVHLGVVTAICGDYLDTVTARVDETVIDELREKHDANRECDGATDDSYNFEEY